MASKYEVGYNPLQDFLLQTIIYGVNISDKKLKMDILQSFVLILETILENPNDVVYLDFQITSKDGHYKVTGKNIVSALWLSGIYPVNNLDKLVDRESITINDREYKFNKKTKKLSYVTIKK